MILTQEAAKDFETEKPAPAYVVVYKRYRKGLFGNESESEDEYGDEDQEEDTTLEAVPKKAASAGVVQNREEEIATQAQVDGKKRFPSSFGKSRTRSPFGDDKATTATPPRPVGLDTAAKKALYNCTLLKVHMHLAPTLAGDAEARSQIPVIAAGEILYGNEDLRFPTIHQFGIEAASTFEHFWLLPQLARSIGADRSHAEVAPR